MITLPPTPWRVQEQGDANQYCVLGADGRWVIGLILNGEMLPERQRAVLERVVVCVNEFDSVENPAERMDIYRHAISALHKLETVSNSVTVNFRRGHFGKLSEAVNMLGDEAAAARGILFRYRLGSKGGAIELPGLPQVQPQRDRMGEAMEVLRDLYNTMDAPRTRRATEAWQKAARFIAKVEG